MFTELKAKKKGMIYFSLSFRNKKKTNNKQQTTYTDLVILQLYFIKDYFIRVKNQGLADCKANVACKRAVSMREPLGLTGERGDEQGQ